MKYTTPPLEELYQKTIQAGLDAGRSYAMTFSMSGFVTPVPTYFAEKLHERVPLAAHDMDLNKKIQEITKAPIACFRGIKKLPEMLYKNHPDLNINPLTIYAVTFLKHPVHHLIADAVSPGRKHRDVLQKNCDDMVENITHKSEVDAYYPARPSLVENVRDECAHYLDFIAEEVQKTLPGKKNFFASVKRNKEDMVVLTECYKDLAHAAWLHFDAK